MTTVAAPVFFRPSCANGAAAGEQLLAGVVGKDVTLEELAEAGLNRAQVEAMIDGSLAEARACNEAYRYTDCKMQVLRDSASSHQFRAECPLRKWTSTGIERCYAFGDRHYLTMAELADFGTALERCEKLGGRLVDLGQENDGGHGGAFDENEFRAKMHFLAAIAPPDGAWIGLQLQERTWEWLWSERQVNAAEAKLLWFVEPPKIGKCRGGYIDPRGTAHNVGSRLCQDKTTSICEFNTPLEALPPSCQEAPERVLAEELANFTAKGCLVSDTCSAVENVVIDDSLSTAAICDRGPELVQEEDILCCAEEDLPQECLAQ
eukprot:evm.model.scf_348EXC.5 EVM.evm.TU.scf_348EXC.5   scf_348EXC:52372-56288(+)